MDSTSQQTEMDIYNKYIEFVKPAYVKRDVAVEMAHDIYSKSSVAMKEVAAVLRDEMIERANKECDEACKLYPTFEEFKKLFAKMYSKNSEK
jgi:hypothetical protein